LEQYCAPEAGFNPAETTIEEVAAGIMGDVDMMNAQNDDLIDPPDSVS